MPKWTVYRRGKKGDITYEIEADEFLFHTDSQHPYGIFTKKRSDSDTADIVCCVTGEFMVRRMEDEGEKKAKSSMQPSHYA